jgi:soluble lytic murein transglycosylase
VNDTTDLHAKFRSVRKWVALAVLAVAVGVIGFAHWRTIRFDPLIDKYSRQYHLDFHLVKALIHEESGFDPSATGAEGELGLMQVTPAVGQEFWTRHGRRGSDDPSRLLEPAYNLEVGCWYLRDSLDRYRDSKEPLACGLARYNAGETRVARWIAACDRNPNSKFVDAIDFPSTREYVVRIIKRAQRRSQNHLW